MKQAQELLFRGQIPKFQERRIKPPYKRQPDKVQGLF